MPSLLVYTIHKSASMFLHRLCEDVSIHFAVPHYSINNEAQAEAIKSRPWAETILDKDPVCVVGPIRSGEQEPTLPEDLSPYSIVLLLRDPRDVLTSLFFSFAYSHSWSPTGFNATDERRQAWAEGGVDAFVLEFADGYHARYQRMVDNLLGRDNVVSLSYEEMVTDYKRWLPKFMAATEGLPLPTTRSVFGFDRPPLFARSRIHRILYTKYVEEFSLDEENIHDHRRQVTPGDHRRKLRPETIAALDHIYRDVLEALDYPVTS